MNDGKATVNYCKDCGYKVEKCLNLPEGKKCCPDCACHKYVILMNNKKST